MPREGVMDMTNFNRKPLKASQSFAGYPGRSSSPAGDLGQGEIIIKLEDSPSRRSRSGRGYGSNHRRDSSSSPRRELGSCSLHSLSSVASSMGGGYNPASQYGTNGNGGSSILGLDDSTTNTDCNGGDSSTSQFSQSSTSISYGGYNPVSQYGYNDYGYGGGGDDSISLSSSQSASMKALRRPSLTKAESEAKLKAELSMVREYKDRGDMIGMLRDQFGSSKRNLKPKKKSNAGRRSSISSICSSASSVVSSCVSYAATETQSQSLKSRSAGYSSRDEFSATEWSIDLTEGQCSTKRSSDQSLNQSSKTIPMGNVVRLGTSHEQLVRQRERTEQIVESLVWFSFHTPRTVLEDLITHELELWRRQNLSTLQTQHLAGPPSPTGGGGRGGGGPGGALSGGPFNPLRPREEDTTCTEDDDGNDSDLSSLSDEGGGGNGGGGGGTGGNNNATAGEIYDGNFCESMLRLQNMSNGNDMITLPKSVDRESALLFVDMSGFTKLSTMLDVESLSKVINSYFDMIVTEVILHGGDILKFAGDAFFAEWKVINDDCDADDKKGGNSNPLADLNASLVSINEMPWNDDDDVPKISTCVLSAAKCGAAIVKKYSDYHVTSASANTSEAMLNVHCGVGVGNLVGLHVGDYKEDQEEEAVELRREFLILGEPIDQVAKAADVATDGEVMASPEAMASLALCCDVPDDLRSSTEPVCIAARDEAFLKLDSLFAPVEQQMEDGMPTALQPYESLRKHCKALNHTAIARLHLQMALYVHPVIRGDELALSAAIQAGKISHPTETLESRHRAEAELRSVYTMFIKAVLSARVTGMREIDNELYKTLADVMHVVSRELDRYSGHLRQFIVDDKGVVLIATFGLRGSTFPNMVANNGLPATFAIHRALKSELNVENRIGATFGKVYCGVVGGVRRHEFAVMGAPVNLAARLMSHKVNKGILVDEAVRAQADARFAFSTLPPVRAKGYDKPVTILEPLHAVSASKKKKSSFPFIGRRDERLAITSISTAILEEPFNQLSRMVFLMGESGMGKSALALAVMEEIRKTSADDRTLVTARSTSTETEQRIPLSSYRKIFLSIIRDLCEFDGTLSLVDSGDGRSIASASLHSIRSGKRRFRSSFVADRDRDRDEERESPAKKRWGTGGGEPESSESSRPRPRLTRSGRGIRKSEEMVADFLDPSDRGSGDESSIELLNQSLLEISAELGLEQQQAQKKSGSTLQRSDNSSRYLRASLSKSLHGMTDRMPKRRSERGSLGQSLHRLTKTGSGSVRPMFPRQGSISGRAPANRSPIKGASMRLNTRSKPARSRSERNFSAARFDDCSTTSGDTSIQRHGASVPYFEKLCWVCEQLDYPYEYADIVGSQFLGLDGANPVTHVDGHIPTMDELVEFLALAFICIADYADLTVIFVDDFQWVDSFSWKIFRVLCKRGNKLLLLCAMRSHDKQAMRRLSSAAATQDNLQMTEISLSPLDFSEIRELMARVLGYDQDTIPDPLCADIFQTTGGLPVYVVQVLENIKRKKTVELDEDGVLKWTAEGLKEKRVMASNKTGAVMEETFLSRFDALDVRVRKVLQTSAVLGLNFALSDVVRVHPEMEEVDIENALDSAVDEMILMEQVDDDEDTASLGSRSTGTGGSDELTLTFQTVDRSRAMSTADGLSDRYFQFSHAMWRKNVLATMLKERKIELHRLIAESMEKDQVLILEESDISRLLTLFDHWKSCGDFCKSAPLALAVGARLEEWDLSAQSLELYEDALEMAFDTVQPVEDSNARDDEWVEVSAQPAVLDLILRLHIRIGLCHQQLGDDYESISMFEDAYNIIKTSSKIPSASKSLMMPIISSLCVLKLDQEAHDTMTKKAQEKLVQKFVGEARENGNPVHIGRALSMEAMYFAKIGRLSSALEDMHKLESVYDVERDSFDMVAEYGREFALECFSESVQWYYLLENHEDAEMQADLIVDKYLPMLDPGDTDSMMHAILPIVQVLKLLGRAKDADWLLKKYVINPFHDHSAHSEFWLPLFNPLAYLLEVIMMEDSDDFDEQVLDGMEHWVLKEENSHFDIDLERKAHCLMGELCWRLANFKEDDDPLRASLVEKAQDLLTPIARYPHSEIFLRHTAQALLQAL